MTRRVSLPGADELFRSTVEPNLAPSPEDSTPKMSPEIAEAVNATGAPGPQQVVQSPRATASDIQPELRGDPKQSSPKHDQKVTFYCTDEELTRLERARLTLRAEHRLPCDRGRLVRAALAEVLGDFESHGASSALLRRLKGPQNH